MKRISFLLMTLALCAAPAARAQDAATEQRLNQLNGKIEDLQASEEALKKSIAELSRQVASLSEQVSKPTGNYATAEYAKSLATAIKEVDDNRVKDIQNVHKELEKLRGDVIQIIKTAAQPGPGPRTTVGITTPTGTNNTPQEGPGAWYEIKEGDTFSAIATAYKKHDPPINVTVENIQKANPKVDPKNLRIHQKIWIPLPASSATP